MATRAWASQFVMLNELLVTLRSPLLAAPRRKPEPVLLRNRLLEVATPPEAARFFVPLSCELPGFVTSEV